MKRSSAILLFLFVCGSLLLAISPGTTAQTTKKEKPVATAAQQSFYESDFLPQIQGQIYKIRKQEYELKRRSLEAAIDKKLLHAEAEKRGMTEQELLSKEVDSKVPQPTQEETDQAMVNRMFQLNRSDLNSDEIEKDVRGQKLQEAREEYFRILREKAGVKIYLLPPKMDVAYDASRVRGKPDAKITIVEFSDFHCPFCLQAYGTTKALLKKYDGKIKLAYRDLPLQPAAPGQPTSAEAARCAEEQGKFWEYHDLLFEDQDAAGEEVFTGYAASLKLDGEQFKSCLKSGKFKADIDRDYKEGLQLGITGTPAFFVDGVMLNGARPQAEFEEVIETELFNLAP